MCSNNVTTMQNRTGRILTLCLLPPTLGLALRWRQRGALLDGEFASLPFSPRKLGLVWRQWRKGVHLDGQFAFLCPSVADCFRLGSEALVARLRGVGVRARCWTGSLLFCAFRHRRRAWLEGCSRGGRSWSGPSKFATDFGPCLKEVAKGRASGRGVCLSAPLTTNFKPDRRLWLRGALLNGELGSLRLLPLWRSGLQDSFSCR